MTKHTLRLLVPCLNCFITLFTKHTRSRGPTAARSHGRARHRDRDEGEQPGGCTRAWHNLAAMGLPGGEGHCPAGSLKPMASWALRTLRPGHHTGDTEGQCHQSQTPRGLGGYWGCTGRAGRRPPAQSHGARDPPASEPDTRVRTLTRAQRLSPCPSLQLHQPPGERSQHRSPWFITPQVPLSPRSTSHPAEPHGTGGGTSGGQLHVQE